MRAHIPTQEEISLAVAKGHKDYNYGFIGGLWNRYHGVHKALHDAWVLGQERAKLQNCQDKMFGEPDE